MFLNINYSFLYLYFYNRLQTLPHPDVQFISPMYFFLPSYSIIISFSIPNVQHVFIFFISASQISPISNSTIWICMLKVQNRNCLAWIIAFSENINIFSDFFFGGGGGGGFNRACNWFFLFCNILPKRNTNLRETGIAKYIRSKSSREFAECLDKAGNILWKRSKN